VRFSVDPWDPAYGIANEVDALEPTRAEVNPSIELVAAEWRPVDPADVVADELLFVDGVRRIEARVWLEDGSGGAHPAICASYAAGAVRCDRSARIGALTVARGLFTALGQADEIATSAGPFPVRQAASEGADVLSLALQERMGLLELEAAEAACAEHPADLLVVDGPLRGRQQLSGAVGYVKTHHVTYLAPELHVLVGTLAPGQRSPLFVLGTSWSRLSWYFRLPGDFAIAWSGVVRGECSADLGIPQAVALADLATRSLQRYASESYKEPRAPQNLYPIAGLERELRRRLGDQQLIYRALRRSAAHSLAKV
jgi:hypothetical protein